MSLRQLLAVLENNFVSKGASHRLAPKTGPVRQEKTFENYDTTEILPGLPRLAITNSFFANKQIPHLN
jgi:hypothetical protein